MSVLEQLDNCDFDWFYDNMTTGQKQHMANRLYKHDNIIPQQLQPKDTEEALLYPVGSRFEDINGREYLLALTGETAGRMGLLNTRTGYPYKSPVSCDRVAKATKEELRSMGPESGLYYRRQTDAGTRAEAVY